MTPALARVVALSASTTALTQAMGSGRAGGQLLRAPPGLGQCLTLSIQFFLKNYSDTNVKNKFFLCNSLNEMLSSGFFTHWFFDFFTRNFPYINPLKFNLVEIHSLNTVIPDASATLTGRESSLLRPCSGAFYPRVSDSEWPLAPLACRNEGAWNAPRNSEQRPEQGERTYSVCPTLHRVALRGTALRAAWRSDREKAKGGARDAATASPFFPPNEWGINESPLTD